MHELPLLTTIAAAFAAAWVLGILAHRLGLSSIVGYLLAGILIGPHTPGFVGNVPLAAELAEVGVILLMFGVGLHFHFRDLLAVRAIAVPGAIGQSLIATAAGALIFTAFGWSLSAGMMIGMAMAVASTVVLMRVLMGNDQLNSPEGHAAVGWLLVEDVITVIVLVLVPALAAGGDQAAGWLVPLAIALGKLAILVALVVFVGSRVVPRVLVLAARLRSRELFTLTVLVLSIAIATGAAVFFGASVALGAFLAGMVVGQSPVSKQAGADALPLRDAFAVLFFVSVGMLFDPHFLIRQPWMVLAGLAVVLVVKPLAALAIVAVLGYPVRTALVIAVGLAQIGEFSFILGDLGRKLGLLPGEGYNVLVACAILSITINPLLFRAIGRLEDRLRRWPAAWSWLNRRSQGRIQRAGSILPATDGPGPGAIIVGYGPAGRHVDHLLRQAHIQTVVIDLNVDTIAHLQAQGRPAVFGDATQPTILEHAGVAHASYLILTMPEAARRSDLITTARNLNPSLRILARARYAKDQAALREFAATTPVVDEVEAAIEMARLVLAETGASEQSIQAETQRIRQELTGS